MENQQPEAGGMFLLSCGFQIPFSAGFTDLCPAHTFVSQEGIIECELPIGLALAATLFYSIYLYISTDLSL